MLETFHALMNVLGGNGSLITGSRLYEVLEEVDGSNIVVHIMIVLNSGGGYFLRNNELTPPLPGEFGISFFQWSKLVILPPPRNL